MKRTRKKRTQWNKAGADSNSGTESSDGEWNKNQEVSWKAKAAKIRKESIVRAATNAAKANCDRTGMTNPRTGRPVGANWKAKRRYASEVFDENVLSGITRQHERMPETVFKETDGLLIGWCDIDPIRDRNGKIAAFDLDYTLSTS